jgi:kynureninase
MDLADEAGIPFRTCREPQRRGGVVILDVPNGKQVAKELERREVLVDYRPRAGIRIAPHFYTSEDELDHTISEIRKVAPKV